MHESREVEFWFEFASNYSYLSVMRIEEAAARHGVSVAWRPFLLGPIFRSLGWETSPFVIQEAKGAYVWRDMVRQCAKYGLPWQRPTIFPQHSVLAARVAVLGMEQGWLADYARRMMLLNFAESRDISQSEVIAAALTEMGLCAERLLVEARSDSNKLRLRELSDEAVQRGIFGAPSFFARGELFWGNDRLEDALVLAAQ